MLLEILWWLWRFHKTF